MGRRGGIGKALLIAALLMPQWPAEETMLLVNVGPYAGGSLGHAHAHIFKALVNERHLFSAESFIAETQEDEARIFKENGDYVVRAAGARSGECQIVPKRGIPFSAETARSLAKILSRLVDEGNLAFLSEPIDMLVDAGSGSPVLIGLKGMIERFGIDPVKLAEDSGGKLAYERRALPPSYSLTVRIAADHSFRYADYCPVLHQWGATEYVGPVMENSPYILPWSHAVTSAALARDTYTRP